MDWKTLLAICLQAEAIESSAPLFVKLLEELLISSLKSQQNLVVFVE